VVRSRNLESLVYVYHHRSDQKRWRDRALWPSGETDLFFCVRLYKAINMHPTITPCLDAAGKNISRPPSKGVLLVKWAKGNGKEVVIANTHMMASDPRPGVEIAIRDSQMREAVGWIEEFAADAPAILVGDFNCYDHGVCQGKEWLADERNDALGIESTNRAYLNRFDETYYFRDPTFGVSSLPLPEMLVGSDVEAVATHFDHAIGVLEDTHFPDTDDPGYYVTCFFKRLFRYRYTVPTMKAPFVESLKQLDDLFAQEIALIGGNRGVEKTMPPADTLAAKISILLQGRDTYDLNTEIEMLEHLAPSLELPHNATPEQIRDILTDAIVALIDTDDAFLHIDADAILEANRCAFYRDLQGQFFGRNRNDRVFHQKGRLSGHYSVHYELMHLSDHIPIVGMYSFV
jgi:endonuclease/exonuclease/phosphatase family metal-dependent hydrolase